MATGSGSTAPALDGLEHLTAQQAGLRLENEPDPVRGSGPCGSRCSPPENGLDSAFRDSQTGKLPCTPPTPDGGVLAVETWTAG